MGTFIMILQFLLGLSIIVGIHELGHLLFAKLFGMRVESYIIGFPPKLFKFKWGTTEYAMGSIPLGGAVTISGMIDESQTPDDLTQIPQPWEFRAKPAWQRLIVILGGVIFNIVSAFIIYASLTFSYGINYLSTEEVNKHGIVPSELGKQLGFREGDRVIAINGQHCDKFSDLVDPTMLFTTNSHYTVLRGEENKRIRIDVPTGFLEKMLETSKKKMLLSPRSPFIVKSVLPESFAAKAGLCAGDRLLEIAGKPVRYLHQIAPILHMYICEKVTIRYVRAGKEHVAHAQVGKDAKLGFQLEPLLSYSHQDYSLAQSAAVGGEWVYKILKNNFIGIKSVLTGKIAASKALSGPIGIVQVFSSELHWQKFWTIVSFLSLVLAFTNLLPIPALDGGHAVWIIYEMVTGRRVSDRVLGIAQSVGVSILLALISYTTLNDILKWFI